MEILQRWCSKKGLKRISYTSIKPQSRRFTQHPAGNLYSLLRRRFQSTKTGEPVRLYC